MIMDKYNTPIGQVQCIKTYPNFTIGKQYDLFMAVFIGYYYLIDDTDKKVGFTSGTAYVYQELYDFFTDSKFG